MIFTSEVSRAFYRDPKLAKDLDAMAAFKDSGDLEYLIDDALVLTTAKDEPGVIYVEVPKVRDEPDNGRESQFRMLLDRVRAELSEIPMPTEGAAAHRLDWTCTHAQVVAS